MKNILITGANGQLGNEMRVLSEENKEYTYFFTDVAELDICNEQAVMDFVKANDIHVIVNCAAYTAVDKAEENIEFCTKLNADAVGYLAKAAKPTKQNLSKSPPTMCSTVRHIHPIVKPNPHVPIRYTEAPSWLANKMP